jgi:3-oxoacyl-[acyl-carrier-protein] synthase II
MTEPKSAPAKEVWITGIGIVSSLGEGLDAHWDALNARTINFDDKRFAPYIVHPLAPVSFDAQIPKKGDQRQMEAWQRIGTYAAGTWGPAEAETLFQRGKKKQTNDSPANPD